VGTRDSARRYWLGWLKAGLLERAIARARSPEPMSMNAATICDRRADNSGKRCMRFEGTSAYVATDDLKIAVNAAIALGRPLLVKGEPGTGKTVLALEIAKALGAPLIEWHIKSTTKALRGLYESEACTNMTRSRDCATANWETPGLRISAITSSAASSGR